jgi:hypothetical protein
VAVCYYLSAKDNHVTQQAVQSLIAASIAGASAFIHSSKQPDFQTVRFREAAGGRQNAPS